MSQYQSQHLGPNDSQKPGLTLNYVFIPKTDSLDEQPIPLPLTISDVLLEQPSAGLRRLVIEELRTEGIELGLRDVRFWKSREPLSPLNALCNPDTWVQEEGTEGAKFIPIPFTRSLSYSLGDWIRDEDLVHLIVTGRAAPFPSKPITIPFTESIITGRHLVTRALPRRKGGADYTEGDRHSHDIPIILSSDNPSPEVEDRPGQTPVVILGLNWLDAFSRDNEFNWLDAFSRDNEFQMLSYVSNVYPERFRIHLDSLRRSCLHAGCLSWMVISPSYPPVPTTCEGIQWGTVDSQFYHPQRHGCRYTRQRVSFRQAYGRSPKVFCCLAGFGGGGAASTHCDIRTFITGIDQEGFTLHIEKFRDSEQDEDQVVGNAQVSWVAFPDGGTPSTRLFCGEFTLGDGAERRYEIGGRPWVEWRGQVTLPNGFTSPPDVFVAFTSMDVPWPITVRLKVDIENVTSEKIEWVVKTWIGTVVHSASAAFLAIGSR